MTELKRLTFINIGNPRDLGAVKLKRRIRSVAALTGWKAISSKQSGSHGKSTTAQQQETSKLEDQPPCTTAEDLPVHSQSANYGVPLRLPDPRSLGNGRLDPFISYPVPFQPWFPWVMNYCEFNFRPVRSRVSYKTRREGLL
jgi:hypothetical protein